MLNHATLCQYEANFMMACWLGRVQEILTLLSLRCANANLFMNFCNLKSVGGDAKNADFIEKPAFGIVMQYGSPPYPIHRITPRAERSTKA